MPDEPVSRREFDQLSARISEIDQHGTRGIAPLAVQLTEVIKDVNDVKREVEQRFDAHERQHEREETRRVSGRRWMVGAIIAAVAAVDGPIVTVVLARR